QSKRLSKWRHVDAASAGSGIAPTLRAAVGRVLFQITECPHEREEPFDIVFGQYRVEAAPVDAFAEEFRQIASRVVNDPSLFHGAAAVQVIRLHQRGARRIDLYFERNAQLLAVAKYRAMNGRNARRAGIHVLSGLPVATLHGPIGKL